MGLKSPPSVVRHPKTTRSWGWFFAQKSTVKPQTLKKAMLMDFLVADRAANLGSCWMIPRCWMEAFRNRDAPASCNQRVRHWKSQQNDSGPDLFESNLHGPTPAKLYHNLSKNGGLWSCLQTSFLFSLVKHSHGIFQRNSMIFWGQERQEDCLGGRSKAASWIGEFLPKMVV